MSGKLTPIIIAALCCCAGWASEVSDQKIKVIEQTVRGEFQRVISPARPQKWQIYKNVSDPNIKKAIETKLKKKITPYETKAKQVGIPPKVRAEINRNVAKRFPYKNDAEIAMGAMKEAELAFPLAKKGDEVTVSYYKGGVYSKVSGKIQGVREENGRTYEINNNLVRVSDIVEKQRIYFDPVKNEAARKNFIADFQNKKKFAQIKRSYTNNLMEEELEKLVANEKSGYIFYKGKWVTAKYVTDQFFNYYRKRTTERLAVESKYFYQNAPKPKKKP